MDKVVACVLPMNTCVQEFSVCMCECESEIEKRVICLRFRFLILSVISCISVRLSIHVSVESPPTCLPV